MLDNNDEKEYNIVSICGLRAEFHPSKVEIRVRVPADALFIINRKRERKDRKKERKDRKKEKKEKLFNTNIKEKIGEEI